MTTQRTEPCDPEVKSCALSSQIPVLASFGIGAIRKVRFQCMLQTHEFAAISVTAVFQVAFGSAITVPEQGSPLSVQEGPERAVVGINQEQ
ncbi:hypothetical protein HBH70_238920 [Parastagonospora nodorum]|nr:hypothetical protein HBH54_021510 [Parastagonospora nodorum]KAH3953621.1 hypothetical protein HBH53_033910 [Parastagonospora nodorum]KAH3969363.1 hypothetical protein HBH51_126060 [Parastagonospora nodorum]KAH3990704.1 hypothetical protein HBH52_010930 [Parastagonospora nodorum]KAH4007006.1 hypothetical protein HBI10_021340 [Parastagonospora nodorum]